MRWKSGRRSTNVEDRRSESAGSGGSGRGIRIGSGGKKGGIGIIVVAVVVMLMGGDPSTILNMLMGGGSAPVQTQTASRNIPTSAPTDEMAEFVSVVLADTEDTWSPLFQQMGETYQKPFGIVPWRCKVCVWRCTVRYGAVLLSGRPESLYRS